MDHHLGFTGNFHNKLCLFLLAEHFVDCKKASVLCYFTLCPTSISCTFSNNITCAKPQHHMCGALTPHVRGLNTLVEEWKIDYCQYDNILQDTAD